MESWLPLLSFAFITSITPGPNNLLLTVSGVRFGFRASWQHIAGINVGMAVLLLLAGSGVGALLLALPVFAIALKVLGSGYLLWLAWGLRTVDVSTPMGRHESPWGFWQALLFQFANPKALVMALTASAALMPDMGGLWLSVSLLCLLFCLVNLPCICLWAFSGAQLGRWLQATRAQWLFSRFVMLLTFWSAVAIWF